MSKKKLTKCKILNIYLWQSIIFFAGYIFVTYCMFTCLERYNENLQTAVLGIMTGTGIYFVLQFLKKCLRFLMGDFVIEIDIVGEKEIIEDCDMEDSYILKFTNSGFHKDVSQEKYQEIEIGEPYFLIRDSRRKNKYISAYRCSEFEISPKMQTNIKQLS